MANYRNPALLRAIHSLPCTARIEGVCEGGYGEPAHSNQSRHGKGKSIKAHDCFVAAMCRACHREIDQGHRLNREERNEIWQRAFEATLLMLWDRGALWVAP